MSSPSTSFNKSRMDEKLIAIDEVLLKKMLYTVIIYYANVLREKLIFVYFLKLKLTTEQI